MSEECSGVDQRIVVQCLRMDFDSKFFLGSLTRQPEYAANEWIRGVYQEGS